MYVEKNIVIVNLVIKILNLGITSFFTNQNLLILISNVTVKILVNSVFVIVTHNLVKNFDIN